MARKTPVSNKKHVDLRAFVISSVTFRRGTRDENYAPYLHFSAWDGAVNTVMFVALLFNAFQSSFAGYTQKSKDNP